MPLAFTMKIKLQYSQRIKYQRTQEWRTHPLKNIKGGISLITT
jgi:hypothetical protein